MARVNHWQELDELEKLKPKIKKARIRQDRIEKTGAFHIVPGLIPTVRIFIPKGVNVKKTLENYPKKLNRHNGLYKLKV